MFYITFYCFSCIIVIRMKFSIYCLGLLTSCLWKQGCPYQKSRINRKVTTFVQLDFLFSYSPCYTLCRIALKQDITATWCCFSLFAWSKQAEGENSCRTSHRISISTIVQVPAVLVGKVHTGHFHDGQGDEPSWECWRLFKLLKNFEKRSVLCHKQFRKTHLASFHGHKAKVKWAKMLTVK